MNSPVRLLPILWFWALAHGSPLQESAASAAPRARESPPPAEAVGSQSNSNAATSSVTESAKHATATSKLPRVVLVDKTLTNDEVRQLFARGYKPVARGGEVYYCRREQETGSRFETMSCRTADQLKQLMENSKDLLAEKQKSSGCRSGEKAAGC